MHLTFIGLAPGEQVSSVSLDIFYPLPAHARDNVVVWVPRIKVLAGGCAVRPAASGGLGNVADASSPDWADSMRRGSQAYPSAEMVMPGNGVIGDLNLIQHTIELAEVAQ